MSEDCKLRLAAGMENVPCDEERCTYWRLVDHLGVPTDDAGCAIQHFALLDGGEQIAAWLLSVKERVESERA